MRIYQHSIFYINQIISFKNRKSSVVVYLLAIKAGMLIGHVIDTQSAVGLFPSAAHASSRLMKLQMTHLAQMWKILLYNTVLKANQQGLPHLHRW